MNPRAVLAAFDAQLRRHPELDASDWHVERDERVIRCIGDGWTGVAWCDLDEGSADPVIAAQIARFAELSRPWEWKHYSYDRPADLADRLSASGFSRQPDEALLVAEIADLTLDVPPPVGIELREVVDEHGVEALVSVHDDVFGGDHSAMGRALLAGLARDAAAARCRNGAAVACSARWLPTAPPWHRHGACATCRSTHRRTAGRSCDGSASSSWR